MERVLVAAEKSAGWDWSAGTVMTVAGGVIALVVAVFAVLTYRRQFPKRQVIVGHSSTSLLASRSVPRRDLEVRIRGTVVADPHYLELDVWSHSRADIPSERFDDKQPLTFNIVADHVVAVQAGGDIAYSFSQRENGPAITVTIAPQKIPKEGRLSLAFVTDGEASVSYHSPLLDIDVLDKGANGVWGNPQRSSWEIPLRSAVIISAAVTIVSFVSIFLNF